MPSDGFSNNRMTSLFIPDLPVPPRPADSETDTAGVVRHLSHELRQPLSTIETAAYYLLMILRNHPDPRVAAQLEKIQSSVQQTNWILSDAVHFLNATPSNPDWVDLTEVIADALSEDDLASGVELDWTDTCQVPLVRVDLAQAQHMIRSVLSVFRQLAQEQQVLLSYFRDDNWAVLECRCLCSRPCGDLFEPFSPHLPAGSGLALASARTIAEAHGGTATSTELHGELTLRVKLPAC